MTVDDLALRQVLLDCLLQMLLMINAADAYQSWFAIVTWWWHTQAPAYGAVVLMQVSVHMSIPVQLLPLHSRHLPPSRRRQAPVPFTNITDISSGRPWKA